MYKQKIEDGAEWYKGKASKVHAEVKIMITIWNPIKPFSYNIL